MESKYFSFITRREVVLYFFIDSVIEQHTIFICRQQTENIVLLCCQENLSSVHCNFFACEVNFQSAE